jgi:hypothetical protein
MLPDHAVHLLHGYRRTTGATQDTLQSPNVFERRAENDVPIILHDKIHGIAGLEAEALSDSLRDHGLSLAAHRGGRHDGITSGTSYSQRQIFQDGKTSGVLCQDPSRVHTHSPRIAATRSAR